MPDIKGISFLSLKKSSEYFQSKAERGILFLEIVTKGELYSKRKTPHNARATIAKHARETYMASNRPKQCCICGYNRHVDIAHIRAVSDFSDDTFIGVINDINNLMALCPNHHWEFDNHLLEFEYGEYFEGEDPGSL